jgi:flagellar biosynthetic protein FliQ
MSQGDLLLLGRNTVLTAMLIAAPFLIVSLILGLIVSVFQAATQIHEQNIVFIPKIIGTGLIVIFGGSWIISVIVTFTQNIFQSIITLT